MSALRRLPDGVVNRIAAGEVVERPASVVKELVENALDAGADQIDVHMRGGGKTLLRVVDNGHGMTRGELPVAVERHATSKLPDDDLLRITTLGFRGEALPSIGAVSRMRLTSRPPGATEAWSLAVEGGAVQPPAPAAAGPGTTVEVRDLFFATPARLKFLRTDRGENDAAVDVVRRLAMAHPAARFTMRVEASERLRLDAATSDDLLDRRLRRLSAIMGRDFAENALAVEAAREGVTLSGWAGLPTLNRGNALMQYLFVNGRPVRDRQLHGAVRAAYQDFLARDRHPILALFLEADPTLVDVNVHPAKTEVRFREPGVVRGLIVGALKQALAAAGHRASTTISHAALGAAKAESTGLTYTRARGGHSGQRPTGMAEDATPWRGPQGLSSEPPSGPSSLSGLDLPPGARTGDAIPARHGWGR